MRGMISEEDYETLKKTLQNLEYLWNVAGMKYTSKIHGVLFLALDQMIRLKSIGDMLEDDIERQHQIAVKIKMRTCRMKNVEQRATIKEHLQSSHENSKGTFKNRNQELGSETKRKKMKTKRDSN